LTIDLRSTEMRALDGRIVILPNAEVLANPIINYTRAKKLRVDLSLSLPHGTEPNTARKIVLDAIQSVTGFVNEPAPTVVINNLTSSSMELIANFWVDLSQTNPPTAKDAAITQVVSALSRQGIEIPHPVQKVYMYSQK